MKRIPTLLLLLTARTTRHSLRALLLLYLLANCQQGIGQRRTTAQNPLVDAALPVAPPSVQNHRRYSSPDQQDFSTIGTGYQFPRLPLPAQANAWRLKPGAVVFGWHPYWMGNAYVNYDFKLLTHVAYYGYQANSLGQLTSAAPAGQGPDSLLARAKRQNPGCKVLLTISYPAAEGRNSLLDANRLPAQEQLLQTIVQQVVATGAHGVNLDFSPPDQKPQLLRQLRDKLNQQTDTLRVRQRKLLAGAKTLQQQRAQLSPGPDSLLLLANEKDNLTEAVDDVKQLQQEVAEKTAAHQKQVPKPLPKPGVLWGTVVKWLELDKEAKVKLAQEQAEYQKIEKQLASQKAALVAREASLRQQLKQNAKLTRSYAARQAGQQPDLAATTELLAENKVQQTANRTQQALKRQARLDLQARSRSYQYVVPPSIQPLTNHAQPLQDFIARLAVRLWAKDSAYVITLNVPAVDSTGTYRNLRAVQHLVSLFVIKAFDYTPYNQIVPGPLAPLNPGEMWGPHSISTSVAYYLQKSTVPRRQLVVGFPQLAKVWQVDSMGGQRVGDLYPPQYWTNRQLRPFLPPADSKLDSSSLSRVSISLAPKQPGQPAPQAWWEDSVSLAPKYDWVLKQQLAGVGIWALGYDDGSAQLWNLVRARLTVPVEADPPDKATQAAQGPLGVLYGVRHVLLLSLVVIIGFLLAGLLLALFLRANTLVPNPSLLSVVGVLIALCGLCIGLYVVLFGQLVVTAWALLLLAATVLLLLLLIYQRYWRQQILP